MILSDNKILEEIEKGTILIEPFNRDKLGTNSYDVHLGRHLACYTDRVLDAQKHNKIEHFEIPIEGFVLQPGVLYLGVTEEYTETHAHIPFLEGKSRFNFLITISNIPSNSFRDCVLVMRRVIRMIFKSS